MTTSDLLTTAGIVLSFSGFTIKGTIIYLKTNKEKVTTIFKNRYIQTFLIILLLSTISAFIPWNKIHIGDQKPLIVYRDRPVILPSPPTQKITESPSILSPQKNSKIILSKKILGNKKQDTVKPSVKYNITAPVTQSAIGDNATVTNNNYEPKPRVLTQAEALDAFNEVNKMVFENKTLDKNSTIRYVVAVQDAEALKFADQIYAILASNGYTKFEIRYAIFTGIRPTNFQVTKITDSGVDVIAINIFSQRSVSKN